MIIDLNTVYGYIKNPDTCDKRTLQIIEKNVLYEYEKIKPLHLELVNKKISFKDNFPELFDDFIILSELASIIQNR